MADPYAARGAAPAAERPAADSPFAATVAGLGGLAVAGVGELAAVAGSSPKFVAAMIGDEGLLPPLARLQPAFAVVMLARAGDSAAAARGALEAPEASGLSVYLVKSGLVGGPAGRSGAFEVTEGLVEAVLSAALADRVSWESDPDFGYEVAATVPGIEGEAADALCPRLLYATADRVYEHAEAVVEYKRRRHERLSAIAGIDPRLLSATGWPIEPTGQAWKD